jgi:hypothetical protein
MSKVEWVTSLGAFPFSFRSKICTTKLGRLRRQGVLIEGIDYEPIHTAIDKGYKIHGVEEGRPLPSKFVYHVENVMDRLKDSI